MAPGGLATAPGSAGLALSQSKGAALLPPPRADPRLPHVPRHYFYAVNARLSPPIRT